MFFFLYELEINFETEIKLKLILFWMFIERKIYPMSKSERDCEERCLCPIYLVLIKRN